MRFRKRPWGWWFVILDRKHFKVKLLRFKSGGQLSTQYHNERQELWLFLKGACDYEFSTPLGVYSSYGDFSAGSAARIGERMLHKLKAKEITWVLEIQYGEKCDEEDIVRI